MTKLRAKPKRKRTRERTRDDDKTRAWIRGLLKTEGTVEGVELRLKSRRGKGHGIVDPHERRAIREVLTQDARMGIKWKYASDTRRG